MTWWQWMCVVPGALGWLFAAGLLLWTLIDPGKGWTVRCMCGHPLRSKVTGEPGPQCNQVIGPRWYWPEWTKRLRFRAHWMRHHHDVPRRIFKRSDGDRVPNRAAQRYREKH